MRIRLFDAFAFFTAFGIFYVFCLAYIYLRFYNIYYILGFIFAILMTVINLLISCYFSNLERLIID